MEPVGLSIAVVTAFKDAYLTAKFIRNTLHSMKTYRSEQSSLVTHLNVEILRLKNFSRIFSSADGNEVDMSLLETVPDQFLQTVFDVFQQLQEVLGQYTSLAASLDADYQKYSPVSPHFKLDLSKVAAKIDDVPSSAETIVDEKTDVAVSEGKPRGFFSRLGFGSTKPRKASPTQLTSFITLTPGVQWLFNKGKLQDMLRKFKEWNDALQDLIPSLLVGFGFYENKTLQDRLQSDGEENMFKGHLELNKLSAEGDNSTDEAEDIEKLDVTLLISLEDAKPKENDPRILVEYKKVDDSHSSADHNTKVAKRRVYAPQLAQLLKTAGEHNFGTLPLNSYAWDPENFQYAFFFDYPSIASPQEPKSLHDFILYGESQFKLELKQRFHVGHALAQSISAFHSDGWVHKKIRSHAVKFFFDDKSNECDFSRPYLTDFEFSRPQGGATRLAARAVVDVEQDVYLHPERYGLKPSVNFRPEHDIYSLGVVLLEIGIWQTAKQIHDTIVKYNYGGIPPPGGVTAQEIKETFILEATERLAHRMGSSYQQAVVACLDGDWDQYTSPREFTSEFQRRVIQKVDMKAFLS